MGLVASTPTPISPALALGYLLAAGCPQSALLMVAAQSAVETAAWGSQTGRGFNNWNFGNTTPTAAQIAAGINYMTQGVTGMKYIAFSDGISGAASMLAWLNNRELLSAASNGDLDTYMSLLQSGCYLGCIGNTDPTGHTVSTTDYANYRAGIASWMNKLSGVVPVMPSTMQWGPVAAALGIAALGVGGAYYLATGKSPLKLAYDLI